MGFRVREGRKGNHRIYTHANLAGFYGGNFDGGHGTDAEIKPVYVGQVVRTLKKYATELRTLRGETDV
jgi:hypothetical protein